MEDRKWVEVLFNQQVSLNKMSSVKVLFCLTCLFLGVTNDPNLFPKVRQQKRFMDVKAGANLTLHCFYEDVVDARFYWYKQDLGQKPKLISTFYKYEIHGMFNGEFKNPRFTLDTKKGRHHLKITNVSVSDSATYYCASSYLYKFEFSEGTSVSVEGSDSTIQTLVHQSASESVQSGGSVTLTCSVQTGTCDGEQSFYWFKHSQESHPGLIYSHGGRSDQCERKPGWKTQSCVYKLPIKNLNASHAGTYYCAVASCGYILFGNGTQLDLNYKVDLDTYLWSGALTFIFILSVLLVASLCVVKKRKGSKSSEPQTRPTRPSVADVKGYQREDELNVNLINIPRRQRDPTWSQCVYNRGKQ